MSNPKDYYKDIFGSKPEGSSGDKYDTVDLDELLRSIDRELGDVAPKKESTPLDHNLYDDILGNKKDLKKSEYVRTGSINSKPDTQKPTLSQETRAIPAIKPVTERIGNKSNVSRIDDKKPSRIYEKAVKQNNQKLSGRMIHVNDRNNSDASGDGENTGKFKLIGTRYILFILIISVLFAFFAWICVNDVFALNKPYVSATITIPQNFTMSQVASELKKAKIIEYPTLFKLFGVIAKADKKIDPGMYRLTSELDYRALVSQMQEGSSEEIVKITIPEGKTLSEVFAILEEKGVCTAARLTESATNYNFDYKFLSSSTLGNLKRLEGYIFPDTYEFYLNDNSTKVITKFLDNFNSKVTDDMYAQAKKLGYSMNEVIIIASLIEKESASDSESAKVASVIYNRLKSSSFPYLQIDATVQYVLPARKAKLTNEDIKIDSPYNTYKYKGLPPAAISNPGLDSINAALYPASTDYYFYALNKNGSHNFFAESDDFDEFVSSSSYGG